MANIDDILLKQVLPRCSMKPEIEKVHPEEAKRAVDAEMLVYMSCVSEQQGGECKSIKGMAIARLQTAYRDGLGIGETESLVKAERLMPYRMLCNDAQREGAKLSPDLASWLFCYVPLHNIWYGIERFESGVKEILNTEMGQALNRYQVSSDTEVTKPPFIPGNTSRTRQR